MEMVHRKSWGILGWGCKRYILVQKSNKNFELSSKEEEKLFSKRLELYKENILSIEKNIKEGENNIQNITEYAISYYENLLLNFGQDRKRKTKVQKFDTISAQTVAIANKKLYVNKKDGFIGYDLKSDEYVSDCSELDNVIIFLQNGTYQVTSIDSKKYIGNNILHVAVWKKNDDHMVYNYVYKDSATGWSYVKRFSVTAAIKDRIYSLTKNEDKDDSVQELETVNI